MAIRVLHIISTLGGGGVEQMLSNYREKLDDQRYIFDFIVHGDNIGERENYFSELGSQIFHAPPKRSAPLKNLSFISKVIQQGNYNVVHAHQNLSNLVPILLAKYHHVPIRISHGHGYPSTLRPVAPLVKKVIEYTATDYFACTTDVGKWLHPTRWDEQRPHSFVMRNAFDLSDFAYNPAARTEWRQKLGIGSDPVMIQVGRISEEKNHAFTISLLERIRAKAPWKLVIVGDGPYRETLKKNIQKLNLQNEVILLGYQNDIPGILSAADLGVMPSISEGLGLAAVEAQASGLPILASDVLPQEVVVTDFIRLLPLDLTVWTKEIVKSMGARPQRSPSTDERLQSYDIVPAAREYSAYISRALGQ